MKDSIIKWVAAFALLAVISVAAIFAVEDDDVTIEAIQERFQTGESKTSGVEDSHAFFQESDKLDRKSEFKKEKSKDKSDRWNGFKKNKFKGKFDRAELDGESKKGRPGMSRPFPPMMDMGMMPPMMGEFGPTGLGEGFMPPMMGMMHEGFMPPMMGEIDGGHWGSHDRHMPPMMDMMGEGFMPPMMGMMHEGFMPPMMGMMDMMHEGFMPPMMGEGFETRESEIFKEIEHIFGAILDSLESMEKSDSVGSKATDEEISQSDKLTLSLIEDLIKETFDQRFEDKISELVDRVAKDAVTQIIEGLNQGSVEQSLEGTTESN